MMTALTGIVLVVALGAIAHNSDSLFSASGAAERYSPVDDVATVAAGGDYSIDVVSNDHGVMPGDGDRVLIVSSPSCGAVRRDGGVIRYSVDEHCRGQQRMTYCVARGDDCETAVLTMDVRPPSYAEAADASTASARF